MRETEDQRDDAEPPDADFDNDENKWLMPNGGLVILNFVDLIEENG
jgi:hypothetical protein